MVVCVYFYMCAAARALRSGGLGRGLDVSLRLERRMYGIDSLLTLPPFLSYIHSLYPSLWQIDR